MFPSTLMLPTNAASAACRHPFHARQLDRGGFALSARPVLDASGITVRSGGKMPQLLCSSLRIITDRC